MMHNLRWVLASIVILFSCSSQASGNSLADCLLFSTKPSAICTEKIIQFEDQYGFAQKIAQESGIDPKLILAILAVESGYTDMALSDRGGIGLMQVTPIAARELGIHDPTYLLANEINVRTGTQYLAKLMRKFGDWRLALAAYNAGPTAVTRYKGIPPYKETQAYVSQVLWWYFTLRTV